jgi:hypothetical protein
MGALAVEQHPHGAWLIGGKNKTIVGHITVLALGFLFTVFFFGTI